MSLLPKKYQDGQVLLSSLSCALAGTSHTSSRGPGVGRPELPLRPRTEAVRVKSECMESKGHISLKTGTSEPSKPSGASAALDLIVIIFPRVSEVINNFIPCFQLFPRSALLQTAFSGPV